jgi:oligoendopeptidase F
MVAAEAKIPARKDAPRQYTWNAESVFPSRADWKREYDALMASVGDLAAFKGHLADSPKSLADYMDKLGDLYHRVGKIYVYASMSQASDATDPEGVSMVGQAGALFSRFAAASAFTDPELLAIGRDRLNQWMGSEPRLSNLGQYVDNLFRRQAHVRSADVEEVLGMSTEVFSTIDNTAEMLTSADMKFEPAQGRDGKEFPVAQSTIDNLMNNPDREVRRAAWENYADTYLSLKNTLTSNLVASVKRDVFFARARKYKSALEASLFQNNIPVEVFDNLINTYKKNLPTWHRYWRVRRKALGVDELQPYDIWAPLTSVEQHVSYQQAVDWICEGLAPLGEDYVNTLRRGCLQDRWVDVYPNIGKGKAQFSSGVQGTFPFIMLNYTNTLGDMSTLAHELGHSMHSYLTWQNQPFLYSDYSLFVAEVASNFNQAMVRANLLKTQTDKDFQIAVLEEAMDNFHRYFFIMPTLARFELEMHQRVERGQGITADDLINLMADLFSEGYGGEMHVDRERVGITWAQFGHLYAGFYVYQYATGISAAHALAGGILDGKPDAPANYLKFLSAGSSLYPLDALKVGGVDMRSPEAVEKAFAVLAGYVDKLEQLTGK